MSNKYQRRLEEVMSLLRCAVSGCWGLNGAETSYYYTGCETNGHNGMGPDILYELAEFEFTELIKAVPLEHFHFSQRLAVFGIGRKEFGQDLELRVHIELEGVGEGD
jgi:hypothetical protein